MSLAIEHLPSQFVLAYERASSDPKERKLSVERQARINDVIAEREFPGVPVIHFCDNDLSASKPHVFRPAYANLLASLRAGGAIGIVAVEQSRLTRQPSEWEEFMLVATRSGIEVVYTEKGERPIAEGNRTYGRIVAILDADEAERTRLRALRYHRDAAQQGKAVGRAFGYKAERDDQGNAVRVIDGTQAALVRRMVKMVLDGYGVTAIAKQLTEERVPAPRGARWYPKTVRTIVTTPSIAALRIYDGQEHAGQWEPIIDRLTWERVRHALTVEDYVARHPDGRVVTFRRQRRPDTIREHLLSGGLLVCGRCGCPLRPSVNKQKGRTYGCAWRANAPEACQRMSTLAAPLEALVMSTIDELLRRPDFLDLFASVQGTKDDRGQLVVDLGDLTAREAHLTERFTSGRLSSAAYDAGMDGINDQRAVLTARLDALDTTLQDFADPVGLADRWEELPMKQKRDIIWFMTAGKPIVVNAKNKVGRAPFDRSRFELPFRF